MPATIGTPDSKIVRSLYRDIANEEISKVTELNGAANNADIETYLADLDALMNAFSVRTTMSQVTLVTGMDSAAENAIERNVSNILELTFTKPHPLNANEEIVKTVSVPAYKAALQEVGTNAILIAAAAGTGTTLPEKLRRLVDFLEDNLDVVPIDGVHYPGGFTWQPLKSGFITAPNVIDGA